MVLHARLFALAILAGSSFVNGWGDLGHKTVASIALHYLNPSTLSAVNTILANDPRKLVDAPTIVDIAAWADDYKREPGGKFTYGFHFVDVHDNPPELCHVSYERDCKEGKCSIAAIANYTIRLQDRTLSSADTAEALKLLVHFIGDVAQPLHNEAMGLGGNRITVTWNGKLTNLHKIWDDAMIDKLAGEDTPENLDKWTRKIVEEIEHGPYADSLPEWVSCTDVNKPLECATRWVEDSNAHVCRFALNPVPKNDTELSSEYYAGAAPIIQQQIAKGGVRLAAMLNGIFVGFSGFEGPRYLSPLLVQEP